MRIPLAFLSILITHFAYSQCKIVGRILDYDANYPIANCIVQFDTIITERMNQVNACLADDSGYFQAIYNLKSSKLDLAFSQAGHEKLILKNIPISNASFIDLGDIWLLGGSYYWDGTKTKKHLWGLFKTTKGCGGYEIGFIEKNKDKHEIFLNYPKTGKEKYFQILDNTMILDYDEKQK
jgi:hypothetical protein